MSTNCACVIFVVVVFLQCTESLIKAPFILTVGKAKCKVPGAEFVKFHTQELVREEFVFSRCLRL